MLGRRRGLLWTYHLVALVAELLAHELAHPVILVTVFGLQTGDYERHVEGGCLDKGADCGSWEK